MLYSDLLHCDLEVAEADLNAIDDVGWPLFFYREYVSKNQPLLIKNGCSKFPACEKWNSDYFL